MSEIVRLPAMTDSDNTVLQPSGVVNGSRIGDEAPYTAFKPLDQGHKSNGTSEEQDGSINGHNGTQLNGNSSMNDRPSDQEHDLSNSKQEDTAKHTDAANVHFSGASSSHVVFLFTGQGSNWHAMGREYLSVGVFGQSIHRSNQILRSLGADWDLLDELRQTESQTRLNKGEISQPATTAIQIALVDLLEGLSVHPEAVLGHSSGEIAAAYAAGALTQESALKVSYTSGLVSRWCRQDLHFVGAMLGVGLGQDEISPYLSQIPRGTDRLTVACVNSPASITISGEEAAIAILQALLDRNCIFNKLLNIDSAYHSQQIGALASRFSDAVGDLLPAKATSSSVRFASSVTAIEKTSGFDSSYWASNLSSQVRFSEALQYLIQSSGPLPGHKFVLVEVGPHSSLRGPVRQCMTSMRTAQFDWAYTPTLVRKQSATDSLAEAIGTLRGNGLAISLSSADTMGDHRGSALTKDLYNGPSSNSTSYTGTGGVSGTQIGEY